MKIFVLQTAFIGDTILTTALLSRLSRSYKDSEIHVVIAETSLELFRNYPKNFFFYGMEKKNKSKIRSILDLLEKLKNIDFDIALSPHSSFRSMLLMLGLRAKRKIAFSHFWSNLFSFETVPQIPYQRGIHYLDRLSKFVLHLDEKGPKLDRRELLISILDEEKKAALEKVGTESFVLTCPTSTWATKEWGVESFLGFSKKVLEDSKLTVVWVGEREIKLGDEICQNYRFKNLTGKTSIREWLALFSVCNSVVSNDSAAVHLASVFNKKVIEIYGPTVPKWGFYPLTDQSKVIENSKLTCRPCHIHGPQVCPLQHHRCMTEITIENVWVEFQKMI
jgi:heptosyltransferase-2